MPKQIKIGFDKVPSPVTSQYPQLVDIQGSKLYDAAGSPLLTEEEGFLSSFTRSENSLSAHVNNVGKKQSVPVEEQFPAESEVSLTLLGVPRSEEQLSLFSDVAVYGLDEENWNYYTFDAGWNYPAGWYFRDNPTYGERGSPQFVEESKEQALYLKTFPVQYSYPFGPQWNEDKEPTDTFVKYMNFIALGKYLYELFKDDFPVFAEDNLITDNINVMNSSYEPVDIDGSVFQNGNIVLSGNFYDVDYGDDENVAFQQIEKFTLFFRTIINRNAVFPASLSGPAYESTTEFQDIITYALEKCRPGNSTRVERFGILESKRSFRYQPGRVSGFTYGIRMNTDPSTLSNFIEWGASNKTDEYMFQLRGSEFNIIRRSVIPLPTSLLERMDLEDKDQKLVVPVGLDNENALYETVISRNKFNGDSLDGNGPSGHILDFKTVTMFKIEFSWYGAIGAKFYAYIPSGAGETRWVLIHTLVIENGLEQPILKNPDFKFKYVLYSSDTENLLEPVYVYKYGSSYYIDGGDEGTVRLSSKTGDTKSFTRDTSILGVLPKNVILNSDGEAVDNNRKTYPDTISVNSTEPVRIDVEEITGSPDGVHYHYSPSLHKGIGGETVQLSLSSAGTSFQFADPDQEFTETQIGSKVIADGIFGTYLGADDTPTIAKVQRRTDTYRLADSEVGRETRLLDGTTMTPRNSVPFTARLSNYTVAASTVGIYANEFKIHWLNPYASDNSGRSRSDYFVGVTYEAPALNVDGDLVFGQDETPYSLEEKIAVEWTNTDVILDTKNREIREAEIGHGTRMEIDFRLPRPEGANSGRISALRGFVSIVEHSIDSSIIDLGDGTYRINFDGVTPQIDARDLGVAEVGFNRQTAVTSGGDPIKFLSTVLNDSGNSYAIIDGDPTQGGTVTVNAIQTKTLTLTDDLKLRTKVSPDSDALKFGDKTFTEVRALRFNIQPLYLVVGMRDGAKVNNIIVEEISPQGVSAHTPKFITDDTNITVETVNGESDVLSPSAFNSDDRLSSVRFDTSTLQPLRRGAGKSNVIYSFYVDANKPERFSLEKIFNQDRKGVTPGLLNNKGIFFTATGLTGGGNIEMTLTVKEQ
jgi:hypothetical protein